MKTTTLTQKDLEILHIVQTQLVQKNIDPPKWGELTDQKLKQFIADVKGILVDLTSTNAKDLAKEAEKIASAMVGAGILTEFLNDPDIDEIYVRNGEIAIEKGGKLVRHVGNASNEYWKQLIIRFAEYSNETIDPRYSAALFNLSDYDDARFTGLLPPIMEAPAINIRKFKKRRQFDPKMFEYKSNGHKSTIDNEISKKLEELQEDSPLRFLAWAIASQQVNVLIAGQFSSGKTTLLNYLGSFIPEDAPVAILETFKELNLGEALFMMRAKVPSEKVNGEENKATMEWVLNTTYTRANPSAIILGEIVSAGEAMQFIKAANLGRKAYSTIHGASINAALSRLESLALGNQSNLGLKAVKKMIADGLDIIVHMNLIRHDDQPADRYISEIAWIKDLDVEENYVIETVFKAPDEDRQNSIDDAVKLLRSV